MADMADYLKVRARANDGEHAPIPNLVWWDWNPNSGDTGGLVMDDWTVVRAPSLVCRVCALLSAPCRAH